MTATRLAVAALAVAATVAAAPAQERKITQGTLTALKDGNALGDCPLKHTDVKVSISAHLAYVSVTQTFANPYPDKIEAVYTFPLGAKAAVSEMLMRVGDRIIEGQIKPREEARQIYETAKAAGRVASLLDQERPNIFTQSVANIEPGKEIQITIGYTEELKYRDGLYEFVFPMVVGPRFVPGAIQPSPGNPPPALPAPAVKGAAKPGAVRGGPAPVAGPVAVPDADKISPPVTPEGTRAGHDISISGTIDAGMPLKSVQARLHDVKVDYKSDDKSRATFELAAKKELPNKDFVLEFATATDEIAEGVITHADKKGGHFMLVLQPPAKVTPAQIRPRELVFIIDISGSQAGFPLETSKAIMDQVIQEVRKDDTFNVIAFENNTTSCWDKPVANTQENRDKARAFIKDLKPRGGTQIEKPLTDALTGKHDPEKLRMVVIFTDGLVGHDLFVLDLVKKHAGTSRVFVYGTGNSANRFLLDNMARLGRGEVEYALNVKEAERAVKTFYGRIDAPVLTDISIDWGDLKDVVIAEEVYPKAMPDLFSVQPLTVKGKFRPGGKPVTASVTVTGRTASGNYKRKIGLTLPAETAGGNPAIPQQWARSKIEDLMAEDYIGAQSGKPDAANKERIVGLGMTYRLMTQYTSFVAVEMKEITVGGEPRRVEVPVEMPEGMSYEGVFGQGQGGGGGMMMRGQMAKVLAPAAPMAMAAKPAANMPTGAASGGAMPAGRPERRYAEAGDMAAAAWHGSADKLIKADAKLTDAEKKTRIAEMKTRIAEMKLAKVLQGLAAKLDKEGNFAEGKLVVKGGKLEVAVYLNKLDDAALKELEKLGFVKLLDAASVQMVIGSIEVKKLEDLAYLDCVRRVDLPTFAK